MNEINRIETAGNKTLSCTSSYPVKDFLLLLVGLRRSFARGTIVSQLELLCFPAQTSAGCGFRAGEASKPYSWGGSPPLSANRRVMIIYDPMAN